MPEEILPVNQKGYIAPIVPTYVGEQTPSDRTIDPYELMEQRLANIGKTPNTFTNVAPAELPGTGRYDKVFPGENMEEFYAQGQTVGSKMVNSLGKGLSLTGTTLLQSTVGLVNGLVQWGVDGRAASFYDNEFNRNLDEFNKQLENQLPNYYTQKEKDADWYSPTKLFSANFFWDGIIKNMGFAAGAALSGGVYAAGLKALSALPGASKLFSIGKAAETLAATEEALIGAGKGAEVYGKVKSLSDKFLGAYKGLDYGQRALVAGLATTGEAGFEAYHNLNDFRNRKIEEYKAANGGIAPTGEELNKINLAADNVGNSSFLLNTALLTATNYIQFPKILGSASKLEKGIINSTVKEIEDVTFDAAGKALVKPKNIFRKIAPYTFSASEAFEEGAQYAIGIGTQDYYNKKYKGDDASFMQSLGIAAAETIGTNEGMENILIGGLSGALMMGPGKFKEGRQKATDTATAVQGFNKSQISDFTKETMDSVRRGVAIQEDREQQLKEGNTANVKDLATDYIINYLTPRIKFGRFDLVQNDIDEYRRLASTEEGFAQLQAEGKALVGDSREAYMERLAGLESTAENVKSLYQSLTLRYGNLVDKEGKPVYNGEVMDKMIYAATKVADYDKRIPQLIAKLSAAGVYDTNIFESKEAYDKAIQEIDSLKIIEDDKVDMKQDLVDLKDLSDRRDKFLKEYSAIKNAPQRYTTPETTTTEDKTTPKKTVKIVSKDAGEEELEVGVEYYAGAKEIEVEEGGTIQKFSKFKLLGETDDGLSIKVLLPNNTTMVVLKSALEQYNIGKVADTDKRENAKFFIETTDHIFSYQLGKGKKPIEGRLSYDKKTDKLTFTSLDGKFRRQVTRDQFNAKEGYTVGQIYSNKKFTPKAEAAVKAEVDAAEKLATRNKIVVDLYNTSKKRLDEVLATLEKNKNKLASLEEALDNVTKTATGLPRKRLTKAITKTINELSKMKQDIETQNAQLQIEKEELEATLPYFQDISENLSEFESTGQAVLDDLKKDINALEEMISHTDDAIKQGNSLIKSIDNALQTALSIFNDFVRRVKEENPNVPFLLSDFQDRLEKYMGEEGAKQFIADKLGFTELVMELEESMEDFAKELNIPGMENKLQKLQEQVKELSNGLDDLINEQMAKAKVLEAFEQYAENYKRQQEEEKRLIKDTKLRQEFLGINGTDVQNEVTDAKDYQAAPKKPWWAVVGGTIGKNFGKSFQVRAENFGNRFKKITKDTPIKGLIVTAKNQHLIAGFENNVDNNKKGLIQHILEGTGEPVDEAIALVMVQTNDDGTYTLVDEFGKPIPDGANPLEMAIYQVFPSSKLTALYKTADGKSQIESMFREDIAKDKTKREALEKQYDAWRKEQLAKDTLGAPKAIDASFGSADYVKSADGKIDYDAQTGVVEARLVSESDLASSSVVMVATNNNSVTNGTVTFNTPLGRIFLKVPGGLVKLLNRKFNAKEANLMVDVMKQAASNAFDDRTIKTERTQKLLNWLKSVAYWGIAKNTQTGQRKAAGRNNIWFEDVTDADGNETTRLFVSGKGFNIPFTATSIEDNRDSLVALFKEMYNNANATMLNDKAYNNDYFEIIGLNADGTPQIKEWTNYQSFLLSGKDRKKGEVPFTTAFKPLVDENSTNRKDIYFFLTDAQDDYVFPQSAPAVTSAPAQQPKPAAPVTQTAPTTPQEFKFDGITPNPIKLNSGPVTFTIDIEEYRKTPNDPLAAGFTVTPDPTTLTVATLKRNNNEQDAMNWIASSVFARIKPMLDAQLVPAPVSTIDVTPQQDANFDNDSVDAPSDEVYRLQNQKEAAKFEGENWAKFEAWLKNALPNIPVYRVKNVIQATNGKQAWGMFRKGAIYVYENAEIGTAYHEVFHAVMNMFTDPIERQILMDEFRKRKGTFTAFNEELDEVTIKYSEATDKQAEEQLAEEFKEFVLTGEKYKPEGSKYSIVRFFSDLVNFIKEMFLGPNAPTNTEKLFDRIGEGYFQKVIPFESNLNYARAGIIDIEDAQADDKAIFSVAKIPQAQVHEIMEHMTYSMLSELSKTNKSLFSVPTLNKGVEYARLKEEILTLIKWRSADSATEVDKANFKILHANVENQWEKIVKKHSEYLKTFSIEFDENDTIILKDDAASGKGDWQDARQIDNFKKTNAAIRLLIGTLPVMEIGADGIAKPKRSTMGGFTLMPTDRTFITLMNRLHSSVNLDEMMNRLKQLAKEDPTYSTLYKRLANVKTIDENVNYYDNLNDEHNIQLISGFWRAFKKQNADVRIVFTLPNGDVVIGDASLSTAARQARSEMSSAIVSSIRGGANKYVKYDTAKKEFTSQAGIKNLTLDTSNLDKYVEFLKDFGIEFTAKDLRRKLNDIQRGVFTEAVDGIKTSLSQLSEVKALTTKALNIDGQLLKLGTIQAILENPSFESTYFNLNGDRVQTYIGTNLISDMYDVISQIKNYNYLGSTKYAYLTYDAFSKGSALLNKMFNIEQVDSDGRRKDNTEDLLKTGYVDGLVNEQTNKKKDSSKLNIQERLLQELNMNLDGYYMNLVPGDASIEWMVKLGQFVSKNQLMNTGYDSVHKIFKGYFLSEVNVAKEDRPIVKLDISEEDIKAGKKQRESTDLRFFKNILSEKDHAAIVKELVAGKSAEKIYDKFEAKIKSAVESFVEAEVKSSRDTLIKYGVITRAEEGWDSNGINFSETEGISDEFLNRELQSLAVNYMIANIEFHKLVYSDPYQYKDELKRIKNFNSPRQPLLANSPGINKMIDKAYNEGFEPDDKIGHTDFIRDFFKSITLTDVISKSELKDYGTYKETDGGGYITMKANRNLRIRAGQWNDLEERQFKFDIAYEKAVKDGVEPEELSKMMKNNPNIRSAYTPIKPIVAGNKADGNNYNDVVLDKFALVPLSFRLLHQLNPTSNAIKLYNKMQKEDIDYAVYNTGRKVGAKTTFNLYNNGEFNTAEFTSDNISNIPFDIIAIQAEVPSKDTPKVTQGSQITKLVTMDFMEAGVPVDFAPEITDIDERFAAWMALKDKGSYNGGDNLYNDIRTNQRILEEKINHGFNVLLGKLGLTEIIKDGKVTGYKLSDKKKMIDTLKDEIYKREINDNIIEAFEGFESGNVVLEATPAYQQIRNILYSIADTNISSQKISGGMKVQAPSTLLESVRPIPGKDGAYQSDVLKFYEKDGERVCEIMVARWFDTSMTDDELMTYFNTTDEGQELLRGVAYRIPTQSQNSIDVFKIAKFLPNGYGDTVIVPSALVKKVGSDFDIDKLSIYLKNIYKTANGTIKLVPFYGFGENAMAKFGEIFDDITKDKKEFAEANITKFGGLQQLLGDVLLGTASDKQMTKWIPIFKDMFGQDMSANDVEQALMNKLEKAGKDLEKLTNADWVAAAREEFIEKYYGKSLENAYIKSLEKLITNPANFDALVQPNSAQELEDLSDEIVDKLGEEKLDYSSTGNMLKRTFMTELRHAFVTGKYAIGIAATSQTNHSQNQRSLIYVDVDRAIDPRDAAYIGDGEVKLPHNSMTINGKSRPVLSMIKNKAGKTISDIIGMFIDGYVDISNGPWIMRLGATPNTAGTWLFLTKIGVPIKTTAYFMNQPIVRDYLNAIQNAGYSYLFIDQIMNDTLDMYDAGENINIETLPNETLLGKMVGKKTSDLTPIQIAQQRLILEEFVKYAKMAEHLFKVQQATSFDTSSFNDPILIFKKLEQLKAARNTVISSADDLLENSFVGVLRETLEQLRTAYSEVLLSEKPRVRGVIEDILREYITLNDRDFVKMAQKTINTMFDWAMQIDTRVNNSVAYTLLGQGDVISAAKEIMEFKKKVANTPNHPLKNNIILNSLQINPGRKDGQPDNLELVAKHSKVYNQNQVIYGFNELKQKISPKLYGRLVRLAILQSGLTNSPISFSSLLPYEDFKEVYNDSLSKLEEMPNLATFKQLSVMERSLYSDTFIVPSLKAAWKKSKKGKWYSKPFNPSEISFLDNRLKKAISNKTIPQMINISPLSREGRSEYITFVWEDKALSKFEKAEMRKKGDYSYIKKGLFKRVNKADGTPIVLGTEYETYIYKAINAWGDSFRANEFYDKMMPGDADSTLGQQSVLDNGYIKVKEVEDSVIEGLLDIAPSELGNMITRKELLEDYSQTAGLPMGTQPVINSSKKINIYAGTGENAELSNFAERPVTLNGQTFRTPEGAFQAMKIFFTNAVLLGSPASKKNLEILEKLKTANGAQAKVLGSKIEDLSTATWDRDSLGVMKNVLTISFEQNPEALTKLLATGNAELTHTQDKGKWGKEFPRLLMEVREELKPTQPVIEFQQETTSGYRNRTIKNASADATIAFAYNFNSAGEKLTKSSVLEQNKKYIPLTVPRKTETSDINKADITSQVNVIVDQLNSVNAKTLNIAGNGIYTMREAGWNQSEVDTMASRILKAVVNSPNLKNKIESVRTGGQTGFDEAGAKAAIELGIPTTILAPKGWTFRNMAGQDISNEQQFKARFGKSNISNIEVISENYTPELLKDNPGKLFLFGDNNTRTGKGGQAIIRDEPNAIGISTKLLPKNTEEAFMSDSQLVDNKAVIDSDIKKAKEKAEKEGKTIVLPKGGFGTGLAALSTKAPQTFAYLNQRLQEEFGFNNTTGELIEEDPFPCKK